MNDQEKTYAAGLTEESIRARSGGAVVKLNSNENPLGPSPLAVRAVAEAAARVHLYPPSAAVALHRALAGRLGVNEGRVVTTAGSVQLLELMLAATCGCGRGHALSFAPCFPAFAHGTRMLGIEHRQVPLGDDFSMNVGALARAMDAETRLVYVANPDNPTGRTVAREALAALARSLPEGAVLVVDEAYLDFADEPEVLDALPMLRELDNVALVRTFSKAWGLAGLRVGYGILPPALADAVRELALPFSVGAPALAGALAALDDEAHWRASVDLGREGRVMLLAALTDAGCEVVRGQGPFVMFRPPKPAAVVFEDLLDHGVAVRPLAYAGLPGWLRVSAGTAEENEAFVEALRDALQV